MAGRHDAALSLPLPVRLAIMSLRLPVFMASSM